jgi:hypothetical protein
MSPTKSRPLGAPALPKSPTSSIDQLNSILTKSFLARNGQFAVFGWILSAVSTSGPLDDVQGLLLPVDGCGIPAGYIEAQLQLNNILLRRRSDEKTYHYTFRGPSGGRIHPAGGGGRT